MQCHLQQRPSGAAKGRGRLLVALHAASSSRCPAPASSAPHALAPERQLPPGQDRSTLSHRHVSRLHASRNRGPSQGTRPLSRQAAMLARSSQPDAVRSSRAPSGRRGRVILCPGSRTGPAAGERYAVRNHAVCACSPPRHHRALPQPEFLENCIGVPQHIGSRNPFLCDLR